MLIAFESYRDFFERRQILCEDYEELASEPLPLADPLFWQQHMYDTWAERGRALWLKVTGGTQPAFCAQRASERAHSMLAVVVTYALIMMRVPSLVELPLVLTLAQERELRGLLRRSAHEDFLYDQYTWHEVVEGSFVRLRDDDLIPVLLYRQCQLATLMATHPRLGAHSPLSALPGDLMQLVWQKY